MNLTDQIPTWSRSIHRVTYKSQLFDFVHCGFALFLRKQRLNKNRIRRELWLFSFKYWNLKRTWVYYKSVGRRRHVTAAWRKDHRAVKWLPLKAIWVRQRLFKRRLRSPKMSLQSLTFLGFLRPFSGTDTARLKSTEFIYFWRSAASTVCSHRFALTYRWS